MRENTQESEKTSGPKTPNADNFFFYKEKRGYEVFWYPRVLRFAALIYLFIVCWSCWFIIEKDENGVIQFFGKHVRTAEPGLKGKLPWPFETVTKVKVTVVENMEIGFRTIEPGPPAKYEDVDSEAEMLTADENIVDLDFIIQYRRANAGKWLFAVDDPELALRLLAQSAMRFTAGHKTFDEIATFDRNKIQTETHDDLTRLCSDLNFGPTVAGTQLQDVHPPDAVMPAFKEVTNAREEKERLIREAEGYRNDIIPRARGEAKKLTEDALGFYATRTQTARGDSTRFVDNLREYKRNPEIMRTRLKLETLSEVLPGTNQWIVPEGKMPLQLMDLTKGTK